MSKKNKEVKDLTLNTISPEQVREEVLGEEKPKTKKKCLVQIEKVVRCMDETLTYLNRLKFDIDELFTNVNPDDMTQKDTDRVREMYQVIEAQTNTLYHLTKRMARKYINKDIEDLAEFKRKSLKR